jgi:hypothetical protein
MLRPQPYSSDNTRAVRAMNGTSGIHHRRPSVSLRRKLIYGVGFGFLLTQVILPIFFHLQIEKDESSNLGPPGTSKKADGFFNKIPVSLETKPFHSTVHCVGETHQESTAWMYRSCHFSYMCFDTNSSEFVLVASPHEQGLQKKLIPNSFVSTSTNTTVALGGINPRWKGKDFNQGIHKVEWFPRILPKPPKEYYMLPSSVLLIPFHSFAAHNVGHLLWDDFLPIYTLLQMFGLTGMSKLMLRAVLPPGHLLYGTCEMRRNKAKKCASNFEKFLPLLGIDPQTFSTTRDVSLAATFGKRSVPQYVCAKQGVAGLGMLTDHGDNDHGWAPELKQGMAAPVQNVAKGPLLYNFRNFMVHNLGLPLVPPAQTKFRIVLSAHSSRDLARDVSFDNQFRHLSNAFPAAAVETVELANLTLKEQVEVVSTTAIFVTTCGGGAMTATFLPRGATLILFYQATGGFDFAQFNQTGGPAYLDWDLFNNAAYLRVHWLPIESMDTRDGLEALMYLVNHEMDVSSNLL